MTQPQPPRVFYIATIPAPLHEYHLELLGRATRAGLIEPDELTLAGALWDRIRSSEQVAYPAPTTTPEAQAASEAPIEGGDPDEQRT